jgi:hypothetical protein
MSLRNTAERPVLPNETVVRFPDPRQAELAALRSRVAELEARLVALERTAANVVAGCPIAQRLVSDSR